MKDNIIPKTIPDIIEVINESNDMDTIEAMENYIGCYYGIPILGIGSIVNFIMNHELKSSIIDSLIMLILCFCFIKIPYLKLRTRIKTHLISIIFSMILIFVAVRVYPFIGPAIWTIAFIIIIISSIRITRVMLNYVTISTFFMGMYYSLILSEKPFQSGATYYILQVILLALIIIIAPVVHLINQAHYNRVNKMYMTEFKQREELERMYIDIAATHAELSCRYNELNDKNIVLKCNEEELYNMAHFDMITELPNRKTIIDKLNELIDKSKDEIINFYIVFIDIDSFKKINDTMGHHVGDLFIQNVAQRLRNSLDEYDLIGRIGGDEFALIIQRNLDREEAYTYLEHVRQEFLNPFIIENNEIKASASFGVATFPIDSDRLVDLMSNADTAMYKAKELGKNNVQFFESSMKNELLERVSFETELKSAIMNNEIFLAFQPIYNLKEDKIRGFELLARWNSAKFGMVNPAKFIKVAEEIGMIVALGEWIIKTACKSFKKLQTRYNLEAVLSVNLSVKQLEDSNIINIIEEALNEADLNPKFLEIEVTESIFINSIENAISILEKLRKMKISVALDDFGTGYSSLNYLRKLPIDILKIDKSFIDDLLEERKNRQIIGSMITLAHNFGMSVVAEGIEEENQVTHLMQLECDYIQGYYISKLMRVEELEKYLDRVL